MALVLAPAVKSAARTTASFLMRWPSTPIVTIAACLVSGDPPAPRICARGGHVTCSDRWPPGLLSCGAMVSGVHATRQLPEALVSRSVVLMLTAPIPVSVICSVTGSCAVLPVMVR